MSVACTIAGPTGHRCCVCGAVDAPYGFFPAHLPAADSLRRMVWACADHRAEGARRAGLRPTASETGDAA
jgi:hypothetical protein